MPLATGDLTPVYSIRARATATLTVYYNVQLVSPPADDRGFDFTTVALPTDLESFAGRIYGQLAPILGLPASTAGEVIATPAGTSIPTPTTSLVHQDVSVLYQLRSIARADLSPLYGVIAHVGANLSPVYNVELAAEPPGLTVVWKATHDNGNVDDWVESGTGGFFDTGTGTEAFSSDYDYDTSPAGIDSYVVLALHCDGADGSTTFDDISTSNHFVGANGTAQIDTSLKKFGTGSCELDGTTNCYVSVADSNDWDFGSGDFTIDAQWEFDDITGTRTLIGQWEGGGSPTTRAWKLEYLGASNELKFSYSSTGSNEIAMQRSWTPSVGTFYHIEVSRDGTTLRMFINGTQLGANGSISGAINPSVRALCIGSQNGGANWVDGRFDELRISKGIARHTSNFSAPSAPYRWSGSVKMTVTADDPPNTHASRGFIPWVHLNNHQEAYFTIHARMPTVPILTGDPHTGGFWNMFQFKALNADGSINDPIYSILLYPVPDPGIGPYTYGVYPVLVYGNTTVPGPHNGESGYRQYQPAEVIRISTTEWNIFRVFFRQSSIYDGRLVVWQWVTGLGWVTIFNLSDINTSFNVSGYNAWNCRNHASCNLYTDGMDPAPYSMYFDDITMEAA